MNLGENILVCHLYLHLIVLGCVRWRRNVYVLGWPRPNIAVARERASEVL